MKGQYNFNNKFKNRWRKSGNSSLMEIPLEWLKEIFFLFHFFCLFSPVSLGVLCVCVCFYFCFVAYNSKCCPNRFNYVEQRIFSSANNGIACTSRWEMGKPKLLCMIKWEESKPLNKDRDLGERGGGSQGGEEWKEDR